jgi:two-component system cell cycle sensor histidine kinase/response regulator CckA
MSDQPLSASTHGTDRAGSLVLVLLFAALLGGGVAAYALLPRGGAANLVTGLLAVFAVAGVFAVFAFAAGLLQFAGEPANDGLPKRICDGDPQAMITTDAAGDFLYANDAYFRLSGARTRAGLRGVERLFAGAPGASEAVYRLAQAAREGRPAVEELPPRAPSLGRRAARRARRRPKIPPTIRAPPRRGSRGFSMRRPWQSPFLMRAGASRARTPPSRG